MAQSLSEDENALLLSVQVFQGGAWEDFEALLPDLEDIPCFGMSSSGEANTPGITPTKCLMYGTASSSLLMNALWHEHGPVPISTIKAIIEKSKEVRRASFLALETSRGT